MGDGFDAWPKHEQTAAINSFLNTDYGRKFFCDWATEHPDACIIPASDLIAAEVLDEDPDDDAFSHLFYCAKADAKWHAASCSEPDQTACNAKGKRLSELTPMGRDPPPDIDMFCSRCLKARPDLFPILHPE